MLFGIMTRTGGLAYADGNRHKEKHKAVARSKNAFTLLKRGKKFEVKVKIEVKMLSPSSVVENLLKFIENL